MWAIEARWTGGNYIKSMRQGWWVRQRYHTEAQRDMALKTAIHTHSEYSYIEFRKGEDVS